MLGALLLSAALGSVVHAQSATKTRIRVAKVPGFAREDLASGDAYHVAYLTSDGSKETWRVDGRVIGDYRPGASRPNDRLEAALSSDGSRFAVALMTYDSEGKPIGPAVHLNGVPQDVYSEIRHLSFGASDRLAYKASDGASWRLIVDDAKGPKFGSEPSDPIFNANGSHFAYVGRYEDGYHLLLDHTPIEAWPGDKIYASSDWRVRGTVTTEPDFDHRFKLGDATLGHFSSVTNAKVSPDGHHVVVADLVDGGTQISIDGHPEGPVVKYVTDLQYSPYGVPWWVAQDNKTDRRTVYRNGFEDGSYSMVYGGGVSFGPGGRSAYVVAREKGSPSELIVDGRSVLSHVDAPLYRSKIVFDDADELHWISNGYDGSYWVTCVSLSGADAGSSRCARKARRLHQAVASSDE